jgi:hypothetical protein
MSESDIYGTASSSEDDNQIEPEFSDDDEPEDAAPEPNNGNLRMNLPQEVREKILIHFGARYQRPRITAAPSLIMTGRLLGGHWVLCQRCTMMPERG